MKITNEKFTIGIWETRGNQIFVEGSTKSIATVHVQDNWDQLSGKPKEDIEQKANLKLLAAAPDMYEALKDYFEGTRFTHDDWNEWETKAKAILSKVK